MTHVPDNINPTTVKPMEVSFIWYFLYRSTARANVLQSNWVPRQSVAAMNAEEAPAFGGTGASELALMDTLCLGSTGGEPIHLSPERAVMQIVPAA